MNNETGYSEAELNCKGCMGPCGMCETKLTPADLALYLGAECEVTYSPGGFEYYDNGGIYLISGGLINEYGKGEAAIKPILRPLSDMTEMELLEFATLCSGAEYVEVAESAISNYKNVMCFSDFHESERLVINDNGEVWYASYFQNGAAGRNTINGHKQTVWLLRHHFDLFGWIDAGLAIDKTKTTQP